jgi:hypothetical protein
VAIVAALPITIPSIVRQLRSLLATNVRPAIWQDSQRFILIYPNHTSPSIADYFADHVCHAPSVTQHSAA